MDVGRKSKYSEGYKEQFLREAFEPGGRGPYGLGSARGISNGQVYRWVQAARRFGSMSDKPHRPEDLSPQEKLGLINEAARLNDDELGEFLRRQGIHEDDLKRWREEALGGLSGANKSPPPSKRLRDLERQLKRKDKALAEAAALLVLSKKARALWGEEDDDTSQD